MKKQYTQLFALATGISIFSIPFIASACTTKQENTNDKIKSEDSNIKNIDESKKDQNINQNNTTNTPQGK
ncbi:hypothetical protein [Mycoplasma miroungirhinis]|uniref:Variable surface lipoprotein n=1 Tax=Mycoplasma miroungirhinis TaxID=754516 RepID=A0A6M4JBH6_9MOLU|nr:hypothetical protein [Mycoplasma miroungirhinis]QJR44353.1 hypothetical protein HLA92_02845 [Mycoplasma miroungirhinis]